MLYAICSRKELTENNFYECICDLIHLNEVAMLKDITHHISTTRFQHCLNVSYYSYIICRRLGLNARSAARAGLLHDLFFYNRRHYNEAKSKGQLSHSHFHSLTAADNADRLIGLSSLERDIIEKHMWPVTKSLPKYKESFVITFVDKYCAVLEFVVPKLRKCCSAVRRG